MAIKFVVFDIYGSLSSAEGGPYTRAALAIDHITSVVGSTGDIDSFAFIYLREPVTKENDCNYVKVRGSLEETMLTIMAADAEHDLSTDEKWAPADHWTLI